MLFDIRHRTRLSYDRPVFVEPLTHRLKPRSDSNQRLLEYTARVDPAPAGGTECVDLEGNTATSLWFNGLHGTLEIVTASRVETLRTNPFDFLLVDEGTARLPARYPDRLAALLERHRERGWPSAEVDAFASRLVGEYGGHTLPFLTRLTGGIEADFTAVIRETGEPLTPDETLRRREGACRDLTLLAMEVCRTVGLAARFVTGYHEGDPHKDECHLHAWFEVYLPGAGWRGYDPTLGVVVADRHVALCAGVGFQEASPTQGTYLGTGVTSRLDYELEVRTDSRPPAGPEQRQGQSGGR